HARPSTADLLKQSANTRGNDASQGQIRARRCASCFRTRMARATERPSNATVARVTIVVFALLLLFYAAYAVRHILLLVLVAAFLAVGLDPAVRRLEKLGLRRGFAVAVIFGGMFAFVL